MADKKYVDVAENLQCWANSDPNCSFEIDVRFCYICESYDVVLNIKTGRLVEDKDTRELLARCPEVEKQLPEITRRLIAIGKWDVPASDSKPSEKYEKVSAQVSAEFPRREELLTAWGLVQNDICVGLEVTVKGVSHVNAILSHMTRDRGFFTSMLVERSSSRDGDVYKIVFIW